MLQTVIVILVFAAAVFYLGRMAYRSFSKNECATGCGKCGVDFSKIERDIKRKGITPTP